MPQPILKFSDKVRQELNQLNSEFQQIHDEAQKQDNALVPGMEQVCERCQKNMERIAAFKAVNFPNKK